MKDEKNMNTEVEAAKEPAAAVTKEKEPAKELQYAANIAKIQAAHAEELAETRRTGEVRYQLALMGAINPDLAVRALDMDGVTVEGDRVIGAEESVRRLMETDPYLFDVHPAPMGGQHSTGAMYSESPRNPDTLSDNEYYAVILKRQK